MARIRREQGGNGIGPYWWPEDDPVCEVPEELARDLLGRDEGFSLEPDPEPGTAGGEGSPEDDGDPGEGDAGASGPESPEGAGGEGEETPKAGPPAKPAARRSRAKGATA